MTACLIKNAQKIAWSHSNADFLDDYNERSSTIFVEDIIVNREEVSEITQKLGVSKSIFHKLIKSYNEGGTEGIGINLSNKSLDLM